MSKTEEYEVMHGTGVGMKMIRLYGDGSGNVYSIDAVELTDECIERIADAVVRKMTKRVCETCKHHEWLACGKPYTYCTEDKSKDPERVDRYFTCKKWEKEI